ncbi:ABC transporter substrate-binding protein [Roseomonas sp. KE2513]|uniref:ABC transporter substrate-binding protein n=1 Tax=Roseomonas sp. KE2513 TaxID=2479202 RepID=UPI0018DFDFE2|nr:ABC transporter substrate-binding protein [Roseomonas sp. KE2513]MBI0538538.1 ABC transporter substrate-binding protein [Roseomonas sp. KE2513]
MSETITRPTLRIAPNSPVFDLPIHVALEHGLFAKEGLDVAFADTYDANISSADAFVRQKEALYESGSASAYNLCEWAGFDRSERGQRRSVVASLRPAVAAQALVTFDSALREPHDLAKVPVAINDRTGSHYTALQLLEGTLERSEIVVEHLGSPLARYEALKSGKVRVAMVMEPYISLLLKEGAHLIGVIFYRGSQVISPELPPEAVTAYTRAVDAAAALITQDFARYKHYIVQPVRDRLKPEELANHFVHYAPSRPVDPARFSQTYSWMKSWGLTDGQNDFGTLVV